MSRVFVWHFGGGVMYPEKTEARTRGRIERGINAYRSYVRREYKIDYRVRRSASEGVRVTVEPVVWQGVDYRGLAMDGKVIKLHNGWIASRGKWYDLFPEAMGLGQIWTHERLHVAGLGHSSDENDLMHSNAPPTLTTSISHMLKTFGRIKLKSQREAGEVEIAARPAKIVDECYVGRIVLD